MEASIVKQIGTPQEIYHKPNNCFVATFIWETNMLEMKAKSIDAKIITVKSEYGLVLQGLTRSFAKHTTANVGGIIYVSIRSESFQAGPGASSIKDLDPSLEEATTSLGISQIYVWRKAILPMLPPP